MDLKNSGIGGVIYVLGIKEYNNIDPD